MAHFPELIGEILFRLSTKSVIVILGPPEKIEVTSSDFASKKTRVKYALGFELYNLFKDIKAVFIFSFADFEFSVIKSKPW